MPVGRQASDVLEFSIETAIIKTIKPVRQQFVRQYLGLSNYPKKSIKPDSIIKPSDQCESEQGLLKIKKNKSKQSKFYNY